MNDLAIELNGALKGTVAERLLSDFGRRIYFPKGIIAQSQEAKKAAHRADATIGMARNNGSLIYLSAFKENLPHFSAEEAVSYMPTAGVEEARLLWQTELSRKNPSLRKDCTTLPAVVPGITAGLSYTADLFVSKGDSVIMSAPSWDNYALIFGERREASLVEVNFLQDNGLNLDAIGAAIESQAKKGAVRILLNFPNNPTGYSPTTKEADALVGMIQKAAEGGADIFAICDDAYFGLFYEADIHAESIFARLSSLNERVLAVKCDGPTKEDYSWGLRIAFLTMGFKGMPPSVSAALNQKILGAIRSSVSCSATPSLSLFRRAMLDEGAKKEKAQYFDILKARYKAVKAFVVSHKSPHLKALPFNSGYFMTFECNGIDANDLRKTLLEKHGIGTIAFGSRFLRIAYSAVDERDIETVLDAVYT